MRLDTTERRDIADQISLFATFLAGIEIRLNDIITEFGLLKKEFQKLQARLGIEGENNGEN